jgi:hypothetical protein
VDAVRTWKRDGSRNVLPLNSAVSNALMHALDRAVREGAAADARALLLAGYSVETPRAWLALGPVDPKTGEG